MTTTVQVKRAVKPLIAKYSDLVLDGRQIFLTPTNHVLRGVVFDRTSNGDRFAVRSFVIHLFEVCRFVFLNWGREIYPSQKGLRHWSNPASVPDALQQIEDVLPSLRSLATVDALDQALPDLLAQEWDWNGLPPPYWTETRILFYVALGNLESARRICEQRIVGWTEANYGRADDDDRAQFRRIKEICRRLALDDRAGLAALLHEWEAQTVKNLKIEHLWAPTPFPLELQDASA
jgi:hypothetical protein